MDSIVGLFGQRVRQLRFERNMTFEDLADATGLGTEMIKKIERGASPTSFAGLIAIAHAFQLDPLFLFAYPGINPVHDTVELLRNVPKATAIAIHAAAVGLADGLAKPRRRAGGDA